MGEPNQANAVTAAQQAEGPTPDPCGPGDFRTGSDSRSACDQALQELGPTYEPAKVTDLTFTEATDPARREIPFTPKQRGEHLAAIEEHLAFSNGVATVLFEDGMSIRIVRFNPTGGPLKPASYGGVMLEVSGDDVFAGQSPFFVNRNLDVARDGANGRATGDTHRILLTDFLILRVANALPRQK